MWHHGLIFKLLDTEVPPALIRVVASFLSNRSFTVQVSEAQSVRRPIAAGVPQGSCLSPTLYALYTNDIPTLEGNLEEWERDVDLALFADDSAYFVSSRSSPLAVAKMQRLLNLLPNWLDKWRMALNVDKTTAILTGRQIINKLPSPLFLRGKIIQWTPTVKYLGCVIDRSLSMASMVRHLVNQTKAARSMLRPVLASTLPLKTKISMYKMYLRSRLTYAAPAW